MYIPPSRSPNIRNIMFRHPHHRLFSVTSRCSQHLTLPQSTYYHNPPWRQQSHAFGFTVTSARLPHESLRHLRPATHIHNPFLPRYCRRGGQRRNLNNRYLGKPRPERFLLSVASSARPLRRPCRAAFCARIHMPALAPSSQHDRLAALSSLNSQAFGSSAARKRKSKTMGSSITHTSSGARGRTQTATPSSRFPHQVNVQITTHFSSVSWAHQINTQRPPSRHPRERLVPQSPVLCRWHEQLLFDRSKKRTKVIPTC